MPKEAKPKVGVDNTNSFAMHIYTLYSDITVYANTTILQRKAAEKAEPKARTSKGKKDTNAPKRALSAYMFFSQDWRERIKAENPDAGFGVFTYTFTVENQCNIAQVRSASS